MDKEHGKKLEEAKMHYETLMDLLGSLGMSLKQFEANQKEEMGEDEEEGMAYEKQGMEEEEEEGEEMPSKKPMMDKGKVAILVAKLKKKMNSGE